MREERKKKVAGVENATVGAAIYTAKRRSECAGHVDNDNGDHSDGRKRKGSMIVS